MTNGSFPDIEKNILEKIVLGKFITIYKVYKSSLFFQNFVYILLISY